MEDELCLEPCAKDGFTYAAVFDGHGGELAAQWLRRELAQRVLAVVQPSWAEPDAEAQPAEGTEGVVRPRAAGKALVAAFEAADQELLQYLEALKGRVTGASGATATVALVSSGKAIIASIGDSAAVLCRGGLPVRLTRSHRVYGFGECVMEEAARVEAAGGWVVDGRVCHVLAVSRAFGDWEFKGHGLEVLLAEGAARGLWAADFAAQHRFRGDPVIATPDVVEVALRPGEDEFLVVATDGLWDCMQPAEAIRFARQAFRAGKDANGVARALCEVAVKRYTSDNVAVIVADFRAAGAAANGNSNSSDGSDAANGSGGLFGGLFGRR